MSRESGEEPETHRDRMKAEIQYRKLNETYDFPIHVLIGMKNTETDLEEREKFERERQNLIKEYALSDPHYMGKDINGYTPFHIAARSGDHISLKTLVGISMSGLDRKIANLDIYDDNFPVPSYLNDTRGDMTPLDYAIISRSEKCAQVLLDSERYFHDRRENSGEYSTLKLKAHIISCSVSHNLTDLNKPDKTGDTPLLKAAKDKNKKEMLSLIERGTNFNAREEEGQTPIEAMLASDMPDRDKKEIVTALNSIHFRDPMGGTPLHGARDFETVTKLIELGANSSELNAKGENFLHTAAFRGDLGVISGYLSNVTNPTRAASFLTSRDDSGQRPLDVLASKDSRDTLDKAELELIAKHIGGILRDKGLAKSTDLLQDLSDVFQKFCKAVGIKTERMEVLEKIEKAEEIKTERRCHKALATSLKAVLVKAEPPAAATTTTVNPLVVANGKSPSSVGRS